LATILIADDHAKIRKMIDIYLKREGFHTLEAADGREVFPLLEKSKVDLILADIMMPVMDGYEMLKALRENHNSVPVLMVTAKTEIADKKQGFELGADDYMTKPIDLEELVLRIHALLRRSHVLPSSRLTVGDTTLDQSSLEVRFPNGAITLPQKEFQLLFKLLSHPNKTFTRRELLNDIWGTDSGSGMRTVDVHISRLRERLSKNPDFDIVTIHSLGYKCVTAPELGYSQ
jgi:DNA-binding response OmpR family regulator